MEIIYKSIEEIALSDLNELIENQVTENQYIDYKECPYGNNKELLNDISSFANANGGLILIGLEEELDAEGKNTGIPKALIGIDDNVDQLKLKYESIIRDGTQPRIIGMQMAAVNLEDGKKIFIMKIPNSLNSPHMITIQGSQRFYIRNSAGKHPMNISEIRTGFLSGANIERKINNFIIERLANIKINQGSVKLMDSPHYLVAHVIPYSSQSDYNKINPKTLLSNVIHLQPLSITGGWNDRFNLHGLITYASSKQIPMPHSYVQLFRTGLIESVDNYLFSQKDKKKIIPSTMFEKNIVDSIHKYLLALKKIGLSPPLLISIALLGVKEYRLLIHPQFYSHCNSNGLIEEDDLILPDTVINEFPRGIEELATFLKPIFDGLWNAAGFPESLNYENGNWNPKT